MRNVFYTNYILPQYMIKAALPYMRQSHNGTVVNLVSIAAIQPRARVSTYSAAKAGLEGLTRTLKAECHRFARFMAVELVCMKTGIMVHNPVIDTQIPEYQAGQNGDNRLQAQDQTGHSGIEAFLSNDLESVTHPRGQNPRIQNGHPRDRHCMGIRNSLYPQHTKAREKRRHKELNARHLNAVYLCRKIVNDHDMG